MNEDGTCQELECKKNEVKVDDKCQKCVTTIKGC